MSVPRPINARIEGPRKSAGPAPRGISLAGSGGVTAAALLTFALLWTPSLFKAGEFALAFTLPFVLAAWVMAIPAPRGALAHALRGAGAHGLWIEAVCIAVAIAFAALSMLHSPAPERAFRVILPMAYGACALIMFARLSPLVGRRTIYAILWAGVAVTLLSLIVLQIGPIRKAVQVGYRFKGFFENSNQLALVITATWPLLIVLALNAKGAALKALCVAGLLILGYALFISGAKTGLALTFAATGVMLLYHSSRTGSLDSAFLSVALVVALMVLAIPLALFVLAWASPIAFAKVESIFIGGISDYQTIQSRDLIWQESLRIGLAHPWLGGGAGTAVLGKAHSHNMVLDYFRGMGVVAMLAAVVLLVTVASRALAFLAATWGKGRAERTSDSITMALYLGAACYFIGNQISDSFSPSTAFIFWAIYLVAYRSAEQPDVRVARRIVERAAAWAPRSAIAGSAQGVRPA